MLLSGVCLTVLASCATRPSSPAPRETDAAASLRAARSVRATAEQRAAHYLHAAAASAPLLGPGTSPTPARETYNAATAELTVLLRSADGGRLWNKPLTLSDGSATYQLQIQPGTSKGAWAPDYFTEFRLAGEMDEKRVQRPNQRAGVGGMLVGVRKLNPKEEFAPRVGIAGAVTATLDFQGWTATLALNDPTKRTTARVGGGVRPLAANFSAPLCHYPKVNEFWLGLMEGLRPGHYASIEGIYLLEPYDPARIPVFYVHGLISTPFIWRDPVNEINEDPELRAHYQAVVFGYPTGNPAAYSALRFREDLAKFEQRHPMPQGFVIISHSMGGLVSQMQTETITRDDWRRSAGVRADALFARLKPGDEISRAIVFTANPKARRVVFISTPHKGAEMADESIGKLGMRLISLPLSITRTVTKTLGNARAFILGGSDGMPDSVSSLSPENPMLHVLATRKVAPPCHSIIGNRGKPGPLAQSSDGVVPYWSSHLDYAKSEVVVPGPHSCEDYPQTIAELKRILHLDLQNGRRHAVGFNKAMESDGGNSR